MFCIGDEFFVHFAIESQKRVLHPAKIVGSEDGCFTAELGETGVSTHADQNIVLFYDAKRKFVQQPAQIISIIETEPKLVISIETVGEMASAEGREHYRVSTVLSDLAIEVEGVGVCDLLDISVTGLSIASNESHGIGQLLNLSLDVENHHYEGRACVQSVTEVPDGRTRYGLLCIKEDNAKGGFRDGLRKLSMSVQRQQLQHLSGMA